MIYPDYEEFKVNCRNSKIVTIMLEMEGDMHTPISIFKKLGGH